MATSETKTPGDAENNVPKQPFHGWHRGRGGEDYLFWKLHHQPNSLCLLGLLSWFSIWGQVLSVTSSHPCSPPKNLVLLLPCSASPDPPGALNCLQNPSPSISLYNATFPFFWTPSSFRQELSLCDREQTPPNKCCIKEERKEEKEEQTTSLLDSVSLLTWGEFGTGHQQDMVAWTAEKVPLWASLLEVAGSSDSQLKLSPAAHVTVDFHRSDRWLGT